MPINNINIGTAANNGTGEGLRLGGQKINANFAFVKQYADNLIQGLKWKQRADLATTANITLSGEQTIDGTLTAASRVLVKDQTNKTENGIYVSDAGAWTRAADADTGDKLVNATVSITSGTDNANSNWTCNTSTITLGTTDIDFVRFQGADGVDQGTFDAAITIINNSLAEKADIDHTHTADEVTETANKLWVSPTEKNTWNSKQDALGYTPANDADVVKSVNGQLPDVNGDVLVESSGTSEAGESIFFLEDEADPVIAGYKVMDNPAQLLSEAYITETTIVEGQILQAWITDVGLPGTTFIPSGVWVFRINAFKSGGSKDIQLYNEIYKRTEAGTETLLGTTSDSEILTDTETTLPAFNVYIEGQTILETDRIVTKTRMKLGASGSNPDSVSVGYSGDTGARLSIPSQAIDPKDFEKKRTKKVVTNTTQYTVKAADFTDFELHFTGDSAGADINVIINTGVCPNTEPSTGLQIVSEANHVLNYTGTATLTPQAGAILKTANDGSSVAITGIKPLGTVDTLGVFGSLEGDGTGGGGTTYDVFTNTVDGLVPAPNVSGTSTYTATITAPTESTVYTEGDVVAVSVDLVESVASDIRKKFVNESPFWVDDVVLDQRETDAGVTTTKDIDWNKEVFEFTMTGDTTFSDINLPTGTDAKTITIYLTGAFIPTFPAYYTLEPGDAYDGAKVNRIQIDCVNGTAASEVVYFSIKNLS